MKPIKELKKEIKRISEEHRDESETPYILKQTKDIVKIINEGWEKHLDKYMNRLKHTCNLCKFVEELLARIKGEEK